MEIVKCGKDLGTNSWSMRWCQEAGWENEARWGKEACQPRVHNCYYSHVQYSHTYQGSQLRKFQESGEPVFNAAIVTREATVMMGLLAGEGAARQLHHWVGIAEVLTQIWMVLPTTRQSFPTAASRRVEHWLTHTADLSWWWFPSTGSSSKGS